MTLAALIVAAALPVVDRATDFTARTMADAAVDGRIASSGAFDPACLSRFSDYPPSKGVLGFPRCLFEKPFKPNPKFWLKGVDFSCASPWNDSCGALRAGTAISKRHIVFAKHFPLWGGVRIQFVGTEGDVSAYHIEKTKALKDCDIVIASLNAELTPDVHPAKILPDDFTNHLGKVEGLPVVTLTQNEKAYLSELIPMEFSPRYGLVSFKPSKDARRKPYHEKIRTGDSGNPTFLIVGNEPVLLFCQSTSMGGYDLHYFRKEVQAAMDELCPGYRLETYDFGRGQESITRVPEVRQACGSSSACH